jgi:malate synthase
MSSARFLPGPLVQALSDAAVAVPQVPGLRVTPDLLRDFPTVEGPDVLALIVSVARATQAQLDHVMARRDAVRAWADTQTLALAEHNAGRPIDDPDYRTVVGMQDDNGAVVVGPSGEPCDPPAAQIPPRQQGFHVTLFGPPDSAKMSINAMNALHRKRPGEPDLVAELVAESGIVPRWGADSEDSKTPIASHLRHASVNLAGCFAGDLAFTDPRSGKHYALADHGTALPIKRIPGLALPDGDHVLDGAPLPLHVVELVQHLWLHRDDPDARVLYIPKLEDEVEAAYVAELIRETERAITAAHPAYQSELTRLILVFENPRAIFRIREMASALAPFFMGGSLGWHDFLASTARLFRYDPGYRIPVKADPNIVIRHIRESHHILVRDLGPFGALKIGGMYGVLFQDGDDASFMVSMVGYVRDVVTQLKRGLDGFWVAHPDFVRIGIAVVQAWRRHAADAQDDSLERLIRALVPDPIEHGPLMEFAFGPDQPGLPRDDPRYLRAVLAAELDASPLIANDDPEEIRYNVFQALQYLADWLCGNGCVALPASLPNQAGDDVFVRIMDDLATTERSRWEVWAEVHHGRVSLETFDAILAQELAFIRAGQDTDGHRIQVHWAGDAARWYPIAGALLRQLMVGQDPPEFVTELLLPFAHSVVRDAADPWATAQALCPGKYVDLPGHITP